MKLSEELAWRGMVNQTTFAQIEDVDTQTRSFYLGVDPSADSMQIGNLAVMMMVATFARHGYNPVLLVGGATGMIGDPDGKAQERDLLTLDMIAQNKAAIARQYSQVLGNIPFTLVDNYDWFKEMNYLTFLREVGKHVPLSSMLARDFIQARLGEDGAGISYAEFSYSLIQGYDFLHLYREHDVTMQLAGADQWGNSIAGVDLIRRVSGGEAHVWTAPLVVNKTTGKKFGKTEGGAIWLDENKTSVYKFYQFWLNVDDEGVDDYLKIYTTLDKTAVDDLVDSHNAAPEKRLAQRKLALEVTALVHGSDRAIRIERLSNVLFSGDDYSSLTAEDFAELKDELPTTQATAGSELTELIVTTGLASSKGEARRFLASNAIYINGSQLPLEKVTIDEEDFIEGHMILKRGKNANALIVKSV